MAVVVLFLPWALAIAGRVATVASPSRGSSLDWILMQTAVVFSVGHAVLGITTFPGHPGYVEDASLALALSFPFVAVATVGALAMVSGRVMLNRLPSPSAPLAGHRGRTIFSIAYLGVPLLLVVGILADRWDFNGRYLLVASPAYYALVAAGIVLLGTWRGGRALQFLVAVVFAIIWAYGLGSYYFVEKYSRDDHRGAVAYVHRQAAPGDLVLLVGNLDPVYRYYAGGELPWIRLPQSMPLDHRQNAATLADMASQYRRIWLILWQEYFPDPDGVVRRWLDEHAFRMDGRAFHGPVVVYGYLTASPVLAEPIRPSVPLKTGFADQLSLLGYDVTIDERPTPRKVHLTLFWQARQTMAVNYSIFAHMINPAGQRVGLGDSQPVNGYLPTAVWEPGQTIRSELNVWIDRATPPGDYRLVVGVYDQATMRRLPTSVGDTVDLGTVRLVERTTDPRGLDYRQATRVQYGDAIQLIGQTIAQPSPEDLHVTLFWRAQQAPPRRYKVFNHLVDATGAIVAQKDGEPSGGFYPTDRWEPGEVVRDEYDVRLPTNLAGSYRLLTGLYVPETGERLPIRNWWPFTKSETTYTIGDVRIPSGASGR